MAKTRKQSRKMQQQAKVVNMLTEARSLVNEETWVRGSYGDRCDRAGAHCAIGYLMAVSPKDDPSDAYMRLESKATDFLVAAIPAKDKKFVMNEEGLESLDDVSVESWNDSVARKASQIRALFTRAIKLAKAA